MNKKGEMKRQVKWV